ncbi:hypothetical protein QYF61_001532 [Mycteria americana]|uniref:Uncharacterized protein n=1 Tax=Mycteria americana TaxID=33587 RepID=A0AAN7S483_MYCAM|nr:hypothetical protein QYF61_001532 [Mycteria americana]
MAVAAERPPARPPPGLGAAFRPRPHRWPLVTLLGQDLGPGPQLQGWHVPGLAPGLLPIREGLVLALATALGWHGQPDELKGPQEGHYSDPHLEPCCSANSSGKAFRCFKKAVSIFQGQHLKQHNLPVSRAPVYGRVGRNSPGPCDTSFLSTGLGALVRGYAIVSRPLLHPSSHVTNRSKNKAELLQCYLIVINTCERLEELMSQTLGRGAICMAAAGRRARGGGERERDVGSAWEDARFRVPTALTIYGQRIIESLRLEKTLRSSSPTVNPTPPCLLNHVPKCHIYTFFELLQGW